MTHHKAGAEWTARGSRTAPHRSTPPATVCAWRMCGIATTRPAGRVTVATVLAVLRTQQVAAPRTAGTQRHTLAVTTCFAPFLAWIGRGWHRQPIVLARAAATLRDRFVVLTSSVGSRGITLLHRGLCGLNSTCPRARVSPFLQRRRGSDAFQVGCSAEAGDCFGRSAPSS
ncbi:hypothetical protein [Chloroflexus sp.]|uniref:hypothetical protein n=1 Tax=Chloroflexus sp. TaxID=1904827 RepID=UPI002ACEDF4C|nr:hypothetical protein [Chloroflexus sp.]